MPLLLNCALLDAILQPGVRFDDLASPGCDQDMENCMDAEDEQAGAGVASSLRLRQKTPAVLVSAQQVAGGGQAWGMAV